MAAPDILSCPHLLFYLDVNTLVILYFVNRGCRRRLVFTETVQDLSKKLGLRQLPATATFPDLGRGHDYIYDGARNQVAEQQLYNTAQTAVVRRDAVTISLCLDMG